MLGFVHDAVPRNRKAARERIKRKSKKHNGHSALPTLVTPTVQEKSPVASTRKVALMRKKWEESSKELNTKELVNVIKTAIANTVAGVDGAVNEANEAKEERGLKDSEERVRPPQPVPHISQTPSISRTTYKGYNVHSYTDDIRGLLDKWLPIIRESVDNQPFVSLIEFARILGDMQLHLGPKPAYKNIYNSYNNAINPPGIIDPHLPGLDGAILLKAVWTLVKEANVAETSSEVGENSEVPVLGSMMKHFSETLDQIGTTCMQGITHRLFYDFVALADF